MSPRFETEFACRDLLLPGLATVLNPDQLIAAISAASSGPPVTDARITYIRYKPGRRCLVAYRLMLGSEEIDIYCKAVHRQSWSKYQLAQHSRFDARTWRGLPATLDDARVTVDVFPSDYRLRVLNRILDFDQRPILLRRLFPGSPELWDGRIGVLAYKPERRFVGQLQREAGMPNAVLKCYTKEDFCKSRLNAKAISSGSVLRLAPAIGRSRRHGIVAFPWLDGRLLSESLSNGSCSREELGNVGFALAEFHAQSGRRLLARPRQVLMDGLKKLSWDVGLLLSHRAVQIHELVRKVNIRLESLPELTQPIHGDFYAKQVVLDNGYVGFIDLDEAVQGDPATDLGNFVAHLELDAMRGFIDPASVAALSEWFLEGYCSAAPCSIENRLSTYTAAAVLRLAPNAFRHGEFNWPRRTEQILDRVEQLIASGPDRSRATLGPPTEAATFRDGAKRDVEPPDLSFDPQFRFLHGAFDPAEVQRMFGLYVPKLEESIGPYTVRNVRVSRYKPQRRCLLEFHLDAESSTLPASTVVILGKVRAKGLHTSSYQVQSRLWAAEFGECARDDISVPQPLGIVPGWNMWLQYARPGCSAMSMLENPLTPFPAERIAEALYKLHRAEVAADRRHTAQDELRILRERLLPLADEETTWRGRIHAILDACRELATDLDSTHVQGIHRDFYPDQVLVDGEHICLVDFDLYSHGDPSLDVGNFVAHMMELSLRLHGHPDSFVDEQQRFAESYLQRSDVATLQTVDAYTTLSLVRHISLSTQFPERRHTTQRLLETCERRLGGCSPACLT